MKLTSIYRYRSPKHLFDELNNQYFYLTPSFNENDINEGRPVFVLKGGKYLWMGLFRFYYFFEYYIISFSRNYHIKTYLQMKSGSDLFIYDSLIRSVITFLSNDKTPLHFYQLEPLLAFIKNTCDDYISLDLVRNSKQISNIIKDALCVECYKNIINDNFAVKFDIYDTLMHIHDSLTKKTAKESKDIIYSIMMSVNRAKYYKLSLERKHAFLVQLSRLVIPITYIVSFSNRYDNDEMWGNYAGGYTGACLEYNVHNMYLHMNNNKKELFKVNYRHKLNKYNLFDYLNPMNINNRIIFNEFFNNDPMPLVLLFGRGCDFYLNMRKNAVLSKTKDWSKEKEYRLIYFGPHIGSNRKEYYPFNILKSVTLGSQINLNLEMNIIALLQNKCNKYHVNGLKLYKINRQDNGRIDRDLLITFKDRS